MTETKLPEIPSIFIEPYLIKFLVCIIEGVAMGIHTPEQARNYLGGVGYFISNYAELHTKIATANKFGDLTKLSDEKMIELCKKVVLES